MDGAESLMARPDVCRCCLSTSGTLDVATSYITEAGIKEVYSDMLQECYGITLSYVSEWGPSRMVCRECVDHLRDACSFRKQVLHAERQFLTYCSDKTDPAVIKTELETDNSASCFNGEGNDKLVQKENVVSHKIDTSKIRKRHKPILKAKKKRRDMVVDDLDSDTPISELLNRNEPLNFESKDEDCKPTGLDKHATKCMNEYNQAAVNKETKLKRITILTADNYIDNRNLRSNITLILKNSTITPFKHINNGKYICLYCDASYLFFKDLKHHVNKRHTDISEEAITRRLKTPKDLIKADISEIKCKICFTELDTIENLTTHLAEHKLLYYKTRMKPSHGILGFNLSLENLKCHVCSKEFKFFKSLSVHMNEHGSDFICHVCGKNFVSNHRLQTHVILHRKTDVKCKHCLKEFRSISARNYHIRKLHNNSKFKCTECPKLFSQYQHRLKHLIEVHRLKKPEFRCDLCTKQFASSGGLRAHVRYSHLKSKEYECEICGKIFVYKWIWRRHLDVHTGTKNYECKYCNKKFAKPYTLEVHVRIHLNDKRFVCTVCHAAFVQKCSLTNHTRVHHSNSGIDLG